jgi:hypothetical protein
VVHRQDFGFSRRYAPLCHSASHLSVFVQIWQWQRYSWWWLTWAASQVFIHR